MDTSEEMSSAPLTAAGSLLKEQEEALAALVAEEAALLAPIQDRLNALRAERRSSAEEYDGKLAAALADFSFEDLTDPYRALEFFESSWNNGRGVTGSWTIYRKLFGDCYLFDGANLSYGEDGKLIYTAPRLGIPEDPDEEKLARTAEKVAAVHRANMEILGESEEAKIPIFFDDDGGYETYAILFDSQTGEWVLPYQYGSGSIARSTELIDVLRKVPTYQ